MCKALQMDTVEIHKYITFIGYGHLQHSVAAWDLEREGKFRYHMYVTTSDQTPFQIPYPSAMIGEWRREMDKFNCPRVLKKILCMKRVERTMGNRKCLVTIMMIAVVIKCM